MQKKMKSEAVRGDAGDSPGKIARGKMGRRMFLKGALATAPLLIAGPTILTPRKSSGRRPLREYRPEYDHRAVYDPQRPRSEVGLDPNRR